MSRRTVVATTALCALAAGGGAVAVAGPDGERAAPVVPQAPLTATRTWNSGPSADYDGDAGSIGVVRPLRVAVPDDAEAYRAVVAVTFTYRTRYRGTPVSELDVRDDATPSDALRTITPDEAHLALAPAPGTTTTTRFVVDGLLGGATYRFAPAMNAGTFDEPRHRMSVRSRDVVLTVDLEPADVAPPGDVPTDLPDGDG